MIFNHFFLSSRSWTYDGCYLKMSDSKVSTCTCNHLTNFAILMSPSDVEIVSSKMKTDPKCKKNRIAAYSLVKTMSTSSTIRS